MLIQIDDYGISSNDLISFFIQRPTGKQPIVPEGGGQ